MFTVVVIQTHLLGDPAKSLETYVNPTHQRMNVFANFVCFKHRNSNFLYFSYMIFVMDAVDIVHGESLCDELFMQRNFTCGEIKMWKILDTEKFCMWKTFGC